MRDLGCEHAVWGVSMQSTPLGVWVHSLGCEPVSEREATYRSGDLGCEHTASLWCEHEVLGVSPSTKGRPRTGVATIFYP